MARKLAHRNNPLVLREHLDGSWLLQKIITLVGYLEQGWCPEYARPTGPVSKITDEDCAIVDWVILRSSDVSRLKTSLDFYMRLLAKIMPDLKSLELNDISENRPSIPAEEKASQIFQVLSKTAEGKRFIEQLERQSPSASTARKH